MTWTKEQEREARKQTAKVKEAVECLFDQAEDDGIDPRLTASNVLWAAQHKIYQLANSNEHAEQIITNMAKQISETMQAMEVLFSDDEKKEIH
tara:strand:- start:178 stop:456 length:279 start_codon:yes stop_codon:yes gene_type:complete